MTSDDYDREMDAWNDANDKLQQLREDARAEAIRCFSVIGCGWLLCVFVLFAAVFGVACMWK